MMLNSLYMYRNLPNKGTGRYSKLRSDRLRRKLGFSAFQRWFRIENRTMIKENVGILAVYDSIGFLHLIRGGVLNWQIMVI